MDDVCYAVAGLACLMGITAISACGLSRYRILHFYIQYNAGLTESGITLSAPLLYMEVRFVQFSSMYMCANPRTTANNWDTETGNKFLRAHLPAFADQINVKILVRFFAFLSYY